MKTPLSCARFHHDQGQPAILTSIYVEIGFLSVDYLVLRGIRVADGAPLRNASKTKTLAAVDCRARFAMTSGSLCSATAFARGVCCSHCVRYRPAQPRHGGRKNPIVAIVVTLTVLYVRGFVLESRVRAAERLDYSTRSGATTPSSACRSTG